MKDDGGVRHKHWRREIRAYMAEHECNYTTALRAIQHLHDRHHEHTITNSAMGRHVYSYPEWVALGYPE